MYKTTGIEFVEQEQLQNCHLSHEFLEDRRCRYARPVVRGNYPSVWCVVRRNKNQEALSYSTSRNVNTRVPGWLVPGHFRGVGEHRVANVHVEDQDERFAGLFASSCDGECSG